MRIKTEKILQYIMIYILLIFNASNVLQQVRGNYSFVYLLSQLLIISVGFFSIYYKSSKYKNRYCNIILFILFLCSILTRFFVGGVGIYIFLDCAVNIYIVFLAISINKRNFLTRFINVIFVLASISLVGYSLQIFYPEILKKILYEYSSFFSYSTWDTGERVIHFQKIWGLFLYSFREGEKTRNTSIFSEPGNYQIVLNIGLFILFYLKEYLFFSKSEYFKRIFILVLAIITCQSTSGYFCFFLIIMSFFITKDKSKKGIIKKSLPFIVLLFLIIILDYFIRSEQSFIKYAFIDKLFSKGTIDISTSTGYWRLLTINTALDIMLKNPLGIGVDKMRSILEKGAAGGALMYLGGVLGIIPFMSVIIWSLKPVLMTKKIPTIVKLIYLIIYFNIELAQSQIFYPGLITVPLFLQLNKNYKRGYSINEKRK